MPANFNPARSIKLAAAAEDVAIRFVLRRSGVLLSDIYPEPPPGQTLESLECADLETLAAAYSDHARTSLPEACRRLVRAQELWRKQDQWTNAERDEFEALLTWEESDG